MTETAGPCETAETTGHSGTAAGWSKPLMDVMAEEFEDWELSLAMDASDMTAIVSAHPTQPGGLPDGWTVVPSRHATHLEDSDARTTDAAVDGETSAETYKERRLRTEVLVIKRVAGGWTMVMRWIDAKDDTPRTSKWTHAAATLEELYDSIHPTLWRERFFDSRLHDYIVGFYDPADPDDAAEMTLVGLGARVTVFPKALRTSEST